MKFATPDNRVFSGPDAEAVVRSMREHGFYPTSTPPLKSYMLDVITRLSFFNNETIVTDASKLECEAFVQLLVDKGYFKEL